MLSSDIPRSEVESHGVFDYISADPGTDIKLESKFRLKALPSTDLGVAFLCCLDGRNIYHAGDLNLWLWEGMGENDVWRMTDRFREYTRGLKGFRIDTAFLPLDTRQGMYSFLGFDYYMRKFKIKRAIPMHFFGSSKIVDDLIFDPISRDYRSKIVKMNPGTSAHFE